MRHLVARIGRLAAALGLAACVTIAPQLDMPRPAYLTGDKMAGSATLVMSESSLSLSRVVELPTGCIGDIQFVDVPLGRSFQRAVQAQFGPLFERLEISSIPRPEADYTVDITLEQVGVRFGCPASPGTYAEARGSMRLIDNRGAELWRAQTTRKRQDMGMYMTEFDRAVGQDISKAMGGLIEEWGQDFVRGGLFAQRRIGGGGAQVAGGAGEMAFWDA
ncbi:MAG: hypothetical protein FJX42_10070, partial [Alphaproteobacteria bacterium]|nr:hypothetical protein [Alphaproteobacteria bacterium]